MILQAIPEVQFEEVSLGRFTIAGWGLVEPALGPASIILAWSLSEVIRYTFYFCKARIRCCTAALRARQSQSALRRSAALCQVW
jgi:hypothetical protein